MKEQIQEGLPEGLYKVKMSVHSSLSLILSLIHYPGMLLDELS